MTKKLDNMNTFIDSLLQKCESLIDNFSGESNISIEDQECKMGNVSEGSNK
jgi:hypothetical protein